MSMIRMQARTGAKGIAAALLALSTLASAFAQETGAPQPGSRQTRDFVETMAHADAFEILEAQTVLAQSTTPDVRAFAEKMIADHVALDRTLAETAVKAGLKPPGAGVGADQAPLLASMQGLTGPAFDQAYLQHQQLAHRAALVEAQGYAASGDNAAIRVFAGSAAKTIDAHRAMADRMGGASPAP